jgi:hypothetical protein
LLPVDQKVSPFFAFLAKTRPKPPFGNPRAFQPSKQNFVIFLVIYIHIDSRSIFLFDSLSLIIESSHVSPAPSPFCFRRQPLLSSATVKIFVAATAAPTVAAIVILSSLSPLSLPPLFCLRSHCPLLPLMLLTLLPSLLP